MIMRLDKYLSEVGIGTRSQIKEYLKQGKVTLNGTICKDGAHKEDYSNTEVCFMGEKLCYEQFVYYILNKPMGVVSATKDNLSETVISLMKGVNTKGLFPVGRLDKDTEGLLLITNDGKLAHEMLSPKKHVEKKYLVLLDRPLSDEDRFLIEDRIDIGDDTPCLPAKITYVEPDDSELIRAEGLQEILDASISKEKQFEDRTIVYITISEGRFHQVKRMFAARGYNVKYLKRISMGKYTLPADLPSGEYVKIEREKE